MNSRDVRSRRDEEVRQRHQQAVAAGQQRVLTRTINGELHSYARDEIGVVTASSHPTVRSAGGFVVMALFFAAVAVFSILLVAGPTSQGKDPLWGALLLTAGGVAGVAYAARLAVVAAKARRLRAERGLPEPTARQFD
ncbi:hypothetical protein [Pseudarthrobacter sulfonivorans]|uniref:hypothetical protein n=1 Tax=Pseudarthrobacter sulfonivorans TaxID=121292 RepID=UPI002856DE58|nr:hypothetical protein [Pseudarthrobacter sulfonivorans]MDR6413531.1 hypothetical protein [Pseudarthrobacter sulfonivorans]